MKLEFPGVTAALSSELMVLSSDRRLHALASAVVGGGFSYPRCIISRHVSKDYHHAHPESDLRAFAASQGIGEPFVGLMTAVYLDKARAASVQDRDLIVSAIVTAGVGNPTAPGLSAPASLTPGTINLILLVDAQLTPAAMVNAVITATEVKTQLVLERGLRTPEGYPASGTSSDAVVVACTQRGDTCAYAGPATRLGWLIGRSLRLALPAALA
jgi:iron complex transport system ATP-binding protein